MRRRRARHGRAGTPGADDGGSACSKRAERGEGSSRAGRTALRAGLRRGSDLGPGRGGAASHGRALSAERKDGAGGLREWSCGIPPSAGPERPRGRGAGIPHHGAAPHNDPPLPPHEPFPRALTMATKCSRSTPGTLALVSGSLRSEARRNPAALPA